MSAVAAVILAAGSSSRLGQPKQLIRFHGEPMLSRTVRLAREAGLHPVFVVLGCESDRLAAGLDLDTCEIVVNRDWQSGIASSIRAGVQALPGDADDVLIMVCDQPRLNTPHLRRLAEVHRHSGGSLTASRYAGRLGVPAIFRRNMFPQLLALSGDTGARQLIERHVDPEVVEFAGGEIDVDTASDLVELTRE